MKHPSPSSLRNLLITLTTTAAAVAVFVGLPVKKTLAAPAGIDVASSSKMSSDQPPPPADAQPGRGNPVGDGLPVKKQPHAPLGINLLPSLSMFSEEKLRPSVVQPVRVNPTAVHLIKIANEALTDSALAERIFRDPDAVAAKYALSNNETMVIRQMTREQFQTAREDAAQVATARLAETGANNGKPTPAEIDAIAGRMVVGRSILAAVGRSYLDAADAHACCPWNKAIQIGVNSDPAMYASVFAR
ncbi:MAG: hypothetical protein HY243_08510 [Proteobacteria bacterium]|nr:hypothetical protein [Pseudomonadota bacterium]